eukprot:SAG31_NODE_690_length_12796_cov_4.634559_3_plen_147_part_00
MHPLPAFCFEQWLSAILLVALRALGRKIAIVRRGGISFVAKARRVQAAGATAVVFVNTDEEVFTLGGEDGDNDICIPVRLRAQIISWSSLVRWLDFSFDGATCGRSCAFELATECHFVPEMLPRSRSNTSGLTTTCVLAAKLSSIL